MLFLQKSLHGFPFNPVDGIRGSLRSASSLTHWFSLPLFNLRRNTGSLSINPSQLNFSVYFLRGRSIYFDTKALPTYKLGSDEARGIL